MSVLPQRSRSGAGGDADQIWPEQRLRLGDGRDHRHPAPHRAADAAAPRNLGTGRDARRRPLLSLRHLLPGLVFLARRDGGSTAAPAGPRRRSGEPFRRWRGGYAPYRHRRGPLAWQCHRTLAPQHEKGAVGSFSRRCRRRRTLVRGLPRRRPPALLLIATLITILLWLFFAGTARDPLFGTANARLAVEAAAVIATSCLFVTGAGGLILRLAASGETGAAATGLQRVLIYALLSFVAAFAALRYFDFDLGAMLTTSAIVSAAIGFAMQSTLGSMIAGIALNIDRMPRVGDGILLDGQLIRIESLSWRRVGGRRENGGLVIIPNARLADNTLEILPHDAPVRAEIFFQAPFAVPPQRICHLVVELVSDLAHVDAAEPIVVSPVDYDAGHSSLRYRIHCRVRRYHDLAALEGEVLRRLWYVFQRQRLWADRKSTR